MSNITSVALAAILRFDGPTLDVLFNPHSLTEDALQAAGLDAAWDDARNCWTLPGHNAERLVDLLEGLGYEWQLEMQEVTWSDELFARAPEHLRERLFYGLAILVNPASGGDSTMFAELRRSWQLFG